MHMQAGPLQKCTLPFHLTKVYITFPSHSTKDGVDGLATWNYRWEPADELRPL